MRDLKYLLAYTAPLLAWCGLQWGGYWTIGVFVEAFVLIPLLEVFLPQPTENVPAAEEPRRSKIFFFDLLLYLHVPIIFGLLWLFFDKISAFTVAEKAAMTLSMGIILGAFGINVGHELGHRPKWYDQLCARLLLLPSLYLHFNIEHNRGHHRHVATDADPASAKMGENVYRFWLRSTFDSYRHAWQLEVERLAKRHLPALHWRNEMLWFQAIQAAYLLVIYFVFGGEALLFAAVAAVIGFLLLETVNYIEHYGLRRKRLPDGRYEPVGMRHSWNSDHELGRIFLYELTRHADHHYRASRKYQVLRHFDESPQLPLGYPGSMVLSLLPPLWFKVMDKRVGEGTAV